MPQNEPDPIDLILSDLDNAEVAPEEAVALRLFGEAVRALFILAFAMDDLKDVAKTYVDGEDVVH